MRFAWNQLRIFDAAARQIRLTRAAEALRVG